MGKQARRACLALLSSALVGAILGFSLAYLNTRGEADSPGAVETTTAPEVTEVQPAETLAATKLTVRPTTPAGTQTEPTTETQTEPPAVPVTLEKLSPLGEFKISHYCACPKCCGKSEDDPAYGITATGTVATEGRTVAVDPKIIPYGSELVVKYSDGSEARYIAEDCGGAIKGNRLDVYMESHTAAWNAGIKTAEVYIVEGVIECPS